MNSKLPQHSPESPVGSIRERLIESTSIACANSIVMAIEHSKLQLPEEAKEQLRETAMLVIRKSMMTYVHFEMERVRMMASCMAFN